METARISTDNYDYLECMSREEWLEVRKQFVPASEVPMIMGDFKSKSSVRLMAEKQGLYKPVDLSEDENIQRGREREPVIRRSFAERHPDLKVTYHPYRIYVSKEHPFMSCTLDAEATVVTEDCHELQVGSWGTVEFKSVGYRSRKELEDFINSEAPAVKFYEQTLAQKIVTKASFSYIVVEYAYIGDEKYKGDLPDYYTKEFMFCSQPSVIEDMKIILDGIKVFKEKMDKGLLPDTKLSTEQDDGEVVTLKVDVEVGRFIENFDQMRGAVERMVEPYIGVVFTEETAKDAAVAHSELNAMITAIDEKRKTVKKKYLEPYTLFEEKAKQLVEIISNAKAPIKEQIDKFEQDRKEKKKIEVEHLVMAIIEDQIPDEVRREYFLSMGGVPISSKWLNKSTSEKTIRAEAALMITSFNGDYDAILSLTENDRASLPMLLANYKQSGSLQNTVQSYKDMKKAQELAKMEEARRALQKQQQEASKAEESVASKKIGGELPPIFGGEEKAPKKTEKVYTFTFKASHTSQQEWKALIAYMKAHGFEYEQIK